MSRVLGLDYGRVRIGLALSDEGRVLASPLEVYARRGRKADLEFLADTVRQHGAGEVVVGLPLNMDGSQGGMADEVLDFAQRLRQAVHVPVRTWDERRSTQQAEQAMIQADVSRKRRKERIDAVAAVVILQSFLDDADPKDHSSTGRAGRVP